MKPLKLVVLLCVLLIQLSGFAQNVSTHKDFDLPDHPVKTDFTKLSSIASITESIARNHNFYPVTRDKSSKIKSALGNIAISNNRLFYKIRINNRSNINYDIDFIRFYVRDLKRAKRTVSQEQEIYPVFSYGMDSPVINGMDSSTLVFAFNKFPVTRDKAFFIEIYEKNGGRHLYLKVRQANMEKARVIM